jgi:hypothetical protein
VFIGQHAFLVVINGINRKTAQQHFEERPGDTGRFRKSVFGNLPSQFIKSLATTHGLLK